MPPETLSGITIAEATTTEALENLRPEWAQLWERCADSTPFQSPAWLIPWWKHIGEGQLWTLALRREGQLVGLAPLYVYTQPESGERCVFLLGIATTDYLDALFDQGFARCGVAAVFAYLENHRDRWDICDLQQLRPGSPLFQGAVPPQWREEISAGEACPLLPLPPCEDQLRACVPGRLLHNLRYYRSRAEKIGPVEMEGANSDTLYELFDGLLRLHRARWSTRGEVGVLAPKNVQAAHRESLPELLSLGALRLYGLRIGGRLIAVLYGFADGNKPGRRFYYYLSGFDPDFEALSPGTLIIGHAVREAVREGAAAFDFLRGQERYKYLWGSQDMQNYHRRLWHD